MRVLVGKIRAAEIVNFPGYLVTADGQVLSCRTNRGLRDNYRALRPSEDAKGYLGLTLCNGPVQRRKARVHRLVAEAFLPNPNGLPCVRHLDGDPKNNAVENLAWGSHKDNENDKMRHGTYELRRNGKLTEADRRLARKMSASGVSQRIIAASFGVSRETITRLLNGATWGADV